MGDEELASERIIVVLGDWNPGIIGLIAAALRERHHRPAVVCSESGGHGTYVGSARSIAAYDITEGITACARYLTTFGGHRAAAGFSLDSGNFELFRVALIDHAREQLTVDDMRAELQIDLCLEPRDVDLRTVREVASLEPFGSGNPAPLFVVRGIEVQSANRVGKEGEHLRIAFSCDTNRFGAIWWRQGDLVGKLNRGDRMSVAFELEEDTFNGRGKIQLVIRDMYCEIPSAAPSRPDSVAELA